MHLGKYLASKRKTAGIKQKDIATACGKKSQFICNIEKGLRDPTDEIISVYIEMCSIPRSELVEAFMRGASDKAAQRAAKLY